MVQATVEGRVTCRAAALEYARAGLGVFPLHGMRRVGKTTALRCTCGNAKCENPGKHPRTQNGFKDATDDPTVIEEWWGRWPDANVGIATGSGLVVVDIDPRHGGTSVGLELPETRRATTGGGGEHWYYWTGDGVPVPNSSGLIADGVDIRGDGGYVVAPPSVHASGRPYGWDPGGADKAQSAPAWLLGKARGKRSQQSRAGATEEQGPAASFIEGGRNTALASLAGVMVDRGISRNAVLAALQVENAERCRPPLDDSEVSKIAWSISRYEPKNPVRPEQGGHGGDTPDTQPLASWLGTQELLCGPLEEPRWVVPGLEIGPGRPGGLWGYGGTGKSWIAIALALCVAGGKKFLSWDIKPGKVAHVSHELGTYVLKERYRRLASGMLIDSTDIEGNLKVCAYPRVYLNSPEAEDWYTRELDGHALCVIDSLRRALPGEDENDSGISNHLDMLARISDRIGVAFVVLHHSGKDAVKPKQGQNEDKRGAGRGSSAIFDASSSVWLVEGAGKGPRHLTQIRAHDNGEGVAESFWVELLEVAVGDPMYQAHRKPQRLLQLDDAEVADRARKGKRKFNLETWAERCRTIYAAIKDGVELNFRQLKREVGGRDDALRDCLSELIEADVLTVRSGPNNAKLYATGPGDLEEMIDPKAAILSTVEEECDGMFD